MVVLFAALIAPFFINWDSYRANFEHEASRILGHPVHVGGASHVSILPSPSLTFTDVEVGDPGAEPLMTIARFSATFELLPLLQGQVHVVSMRLEQPVVHVTAGAGGAVDWMERIAPAQKVDPDRVSLADVRVEGGVITYRDAGTGVDLAFDDVDANVSATSLAGPWRVDGTYKQDGVAVPFRLATGRQLEDGTIRLQAEVSPAEAPVSVTTDGVLAATPAAGVTYTGTYTFAGANDASAANADTDATDAGTTAAPSGIRSDGSFTLSRDRLVIDKAVLSDGPADRPTSIAGSLTVGFGSGARFDATGTASQLDLDTALGGGPSAPVNVADAASNFIGLLSTLPAPPIPGRIAINVPAIVVGGSVIQGVDFAVEPGAAGWKVEGLKADLPGQAHVEADGVVSTGKAVGFAGTARLAVAQPAAFAAWWRGGSQTATAGALPPFDISGDVEVAQGRVSLDNIAAQIGDASISGRFAWSESARDHSRHLGTDLKADTIDFDEVRALAGLIAGRDLSNVSGLADSYAVRLAADAFVYDGVTLKSVAVDADYSGDVLNVVQLAVGDLGGASFRVTSGRIDGVTTAPRGHLDARLEATTFDGLTAIAAKFLPDSGLADWLARTAPGLSPAGLDVKIMAPPKPGAAGFEIAVAGSAGQTSITATVDSAAATLAGWRSAPAALAINLDSPDSAAFAHQFGLAAATVDNDPGAHVALNGKGAPDSGLDTTAEADFAGLSLAGKGKLALAADLTPAFSGTFVAKADDLAPFAAAAGLAVPGAAGSALAASGSFSTSGPSATMTWRGGTVAGSTVGGKITVARAADASWHLDGSLTTDTVDLGWLASLSLGSSPAPTGNPKTPWPKAPFSGPTYGGLSGKLDVAADHLTVGALDVTGSALSIALAPQRIDIDMKGGRLAGGAAGGGVSIQNVDGNAHVTGQFNLTGAALDALAWQRDGRVVATGGLDLSANFEATGRSAAGLVSSMTGGGVIAIHNGVARYVNPGTASAIIRISDLGDPIGADQLRASVEGQIDGDSFAFGEAGGAFAVAGGTVRLSGLSARSPALAATGNATIDLNALALDSDWTLTFPIADAAADAGDADIGLVFRGPLAAPARIVDAVPFNAYLNARQASRMLQLIATEEADRAEHQRFVQQIAKIKDDEAAAARAQQAAADAERRRVQAAADAVLRVALLHVDREIAADDRQATALARAAALTAAAAATAQSAATALAADATAKAAASDSAAAVLKQAIASDDAAAAQAANTAAQLIQAQATATATAATAKNSRATADGAAKQAAVAAAALQAAQAAADKGKASAAAASTALAAANDRLAAARAAAASATSDAADAKAAVTAAAANLATATATRKAAADAYTAAKGDLAGAAAAADAATAAAGKASDAAAETDAERARLAIVAMSSAKDAALADDARAASATAVTAANNALMAAIAASAAAQSADPGAVTPDVAGKKALVDQAKAQVQAATDEGAVAERKAADADDKASTAKAATDAAAAEAAAAADAFAKANGAKSAALALLADKTAARDAAMRAFDDADTAATQATAALAAAQSAATAANGKATAAQAALAAATRDQAAAAAARSGIDDTGLAAALQKATDDQTSAAAAAASARQIADSDAAAALAAADALAGISSAHDAAAAAADVAHAARVAAEAAAQTAAAAAADAKAKADAAAQEAAARAADAAAAAARLPQEAAAAPAKPAPPPTPVPRPRSKPAANAPLSIVPVQ